MSDNFSLLHELSESRLMPTKRDLYEYDTDELAELACLYILSVRILLREHETKIFAEQYCRKTTSYGGFKKWYSDENDLYVILFGLLSDTARIENQDKHIVSMPIDSLLVYRWLKAAGDHSLDKQKDLTKRLFVKLDGMFRIQNSSLRAIRRLVMDWDEINHTQKKLALTRLLQIMRNRAPKSELLQKLNRIASAHDLEFDDDEITNPEEKKKVKEQSFLQSLALDSMAESATAGATSAASIAAVPGGLGAGFDTDYSKSVYPAPKKDKPKSTKSIVIKRIVEMQRLDQLSQNDIRQGLKIAKETCKNVFDHIDDLTIKIGKDGRDIFFSFVQDNKIVGFALLKKWKEKNISGYIVSQIYISRNLQGQGIGTKFYRLLILQHNYTLVSGNTQTVSSEHLWKKLQQMSDIKILANTGYEDEDDDTHQSVIVPADSIDDHFSEKNWDVQLIAMKR